MVAGKDNRLGARPDAQLVEHVRRVVPHRLVTDRKTPGDLAQGARLADGIRSRAAILSKPGQAAHGSLAPHAPTRCSRELVPYEADYVFFRGETGEPEGLESHHR
jgi:hypothetical protein